METASLPGDDKRMSNYISRLIARSYNRIETIQPRLPAMFEPHINDALDFHKREVDINPTHHSSKEDEVISTLPESTKQILSNPVNKKIRTGKNDPELHTSFRLQSYKPKDLANTNETDPGISHESLNFINTNTEYPEEVGDTTIDENASHDLFFKPDNNQTQNADILGYQNLIDQTIESKSQPGEPGLLQLSGQDQLNVSRDTLSEQNVSTSGQVSTEQSGCQILEKLNDKPDPSNSMRYEINNIQQRNEMESNSRSSDNSDIENIIQPVIINQTQPNQNNRRLQESIPQESSFHPFKGKLVAQSGIGKNDNYPIDINDSSQQSVIRVNIGRIEVRAVQPPTPPPQPQSKQFKPILSLDDYLSQRNGG